MLLVLLVQCVLSGAPTVDLLESCTGWVLTGILSPSIREDLKLVTDGAFLVFWFKRFSSVLNNLCVTS